MPRYASQSLAAIDPQFRKANNIGSGGGQNRKYTYGKGVWIASGTEFFADGLTLRLLPIYDETAKDAQGNRAFVPFRDGDAVGSYGDWMRLVTCAHWVGNPGVCFIVHDGNPDLNIYDSPYYILRNVAYNHSSLKKDGLPHPTYGRLFDELLSKNFVPKTHVGSLRKPEPIAFISASVVDLDETGQPTLMTFGNDEKRNARIIGLKKSCAESFNAALAVVDDNTGEYLAGDMLSFGPAKLVTFVNNEFKLNPPARNSNAFSLQGPTGIQVPKKCQQSTPVIHGNCITPSAMTYRAVIHDTYNGRPISLEPYAERIAAESKSWDEYLHVPSYGEQAELLATAFDRDVLRFAWQEHPEYLRVLPRGTTTSAPLPERDVENLEMDDVPFDAPAPQPVQRPTPRSVPVNQPVQSAPLAGDLSADEEAGVDDMFAAATQAPPAGEPVAAPKPQSNVADIVAKARERAARGR